MTRLGWKKRNIIPEVNNLGYCVFVVSEKFLTIVDGLATGILVAFPKLGMLSINWTVILKMLSKFWHRSPNTSGEGSQLEKAK